MGSYFHLSLFCLLVFGCFLQEAQSCPQDWIFYQENCYGLFKKLLSWHDAEMQCQTYGKNSHLASILNKREMRVIDSYINNNYEGLSHVWIGLKNIQSGKVERWRWRDMAVVNYAPWAPVKLNPQLSNIKACGKLSDKDRMQWHYDKCENKHPYLCKVPEV